VWLNAAVVPQPELILDYASRRKRSAFRLASGSILDAAWSGDRERYTVHERLAGQAGAVAAIVFCLFSLPLLIGISIAEARRADAGLFVLIAVAILIGITLVPMTIQQNWYQIRLTVFDRHLHLRMGGPLRKHDWTWPAADVDSVRLLNTQNEPDAPLLAEIEILARGVPPIRLFTDHLESELTRIATEINRALHGETPPPPSAPSPRTTESLRQSGHRL
jgi:hypothetical protein